MKSIIVCIITLLIAPVAFSGDQSQANSAGAVMQSPQVKLYIIPSSLSSAESPQYRMKGSSGQTLLQTATSASYGLQSGYWEAVVAEPGEGCCIGLAGNVNKDAGEEPDISDLTYLVNHLFVTFQQLPCPPEANIDGSTNCTVDISDLTRLVNFLFVTFVAPEPCLPACE